MSATKLQINNVIERLYDQYYQEFFAMLDSKPKLKTYKTFKLQFCQEKYLTCIRNDLHRISLSRLRCSSHKLAIEEGQYRSIEQSNIKCICCKMNTVEDEYHWYVPIIGKKERSAFKKTIAIGHLFKNFKGF